MKVYYLTLGKAISHGNLINTLTFLPVITSDVYCLICYNKSYLPTTQLTLNRSCRGNVATIEKSPDETGISGDRRDISFLENCNPSYTRKAAESKQKSCLNRLGEAEGLFCWWSLSSLFPSCRESRDPHLHTMP